MIAIPRGPGAAGGPAAGGQPAAATRAAGTTAAPGAGRLDIAVHVAAENVAAKRTAAKLLGGSADSRRSAGATFDREL